MSRTQSALVRVFAMIVVPFAVMTLYLASLARQGTNETMDWVALLTSVLAGVGILATLPMEKWQKILATFLFIPTMGMGLVLYGFSFVCGAYGRCL